jgi:hypothetical protein
MMGKFVVAEQGHIVQLIDPQSQSAALTSEIFTMENWAHATILVFGGAGSATTVTVSECDNFTPTTAATKTFMYAVEATAVSIGTATGTILCIEIDNDELTDGYPCIQINMSDPGTSKLVSAVAILSGGRYQKDITATAES